ncbi:hypothetical protein PPERSA_11292 [Pseudocohnilembus persalinus]|uniref:t-SNARE coiled-coil homology domain-containing protein n=1 Tax=Pseudocohnilembus persalinus TaxID=266149 RepID=A0A0V0QPY8_PSEPJ|nr:hypothetical protein PPERSA_11292 [Pseudocohnilembus persalinus]|eukprot:KRX04168.1 hypothetical protein PPERSA_11292 [Pseudocohnilembus persalinus]
MSSIQEFEPNIYTYISEIEKKFIQLDKKKDPSGRNLINKQIALKIKQTQSLISAYELEIESLGPNQAASYKNSLKKCQEKCQQVQNEFEYKKNQIDGPSESKNQFGVQQAGMSAQQQQLFGGMNKSGNRRSQSRIDTNTDMNNLNQQQLIGLGDQKQKEALDALDLIDYRVQQDNEIADGVLLELDRQIETLDRISNKVKDTDLVLKRTKRLIRYFGRVIQTDKIIMGFMCLLFVALLVVIIMGIAGYSPKDAVDAI